MTLGISTASSYCSRYPFSFHDYMRHKDKLITVPLCILKLGQGAGGGGGNGEDRGKQIASNLTEKMMVLHENMQNRAF